jgi:hypothetical protein
MARKDYPFNRRDEKKMNKLFSSFITGIILAPIALLNSNCKVDIDKDESKIGYSEQAAIGLLLGIISTPFYIALLCKVNEYSDGAIATWIISILFILLWVCIIYLFLKARNN